MEKLQNHSRSATSDERRMNLAKSAAVLSKFFQKWQVVFPNHPASKAALAVYLEALQELSPSQIEIGCEEAQKKMEQFPKPGHIREGWLARRSVGFESLGPPLLEWNEREDMTDAERKEAAEMCAKLRRNLGEPARAIRKANREPIRRGFKPASEQIAEMKAKGYL